MGKSRAEIQKEYRERKKAEKGNEYLKKEAQRAKKNYVPTVQLSKKKLQKRRTKIKNAMIYKRAQERAQERVHADTDTDENNNSLTHSTLQLTMDLDSGNGPCDYTTATCVSTTATCDMSRPTPGTSAERQSVARNNLTVKMNFPVSKRGRKRKSEGLIRAESKIRKLQCDLDNARRRNCVYRQRLSRKDKYDLQLSNTKSTSSTHRAESMPEHRPNIISLTPRSRSKAILKTSGISPRRHKTIARKLQLHESMIDSMKGKVQAVNVVCDRATKRSRQISAVSETLNLCRHKLMRQMRGPTNMQRRKMVENARTKANVVEFMERDDNSACLPGKRDFLKTDKEVHQKRVLNDLLSNMHTKFRSENPEIRINLTRFGSYRPKYIKLVYYSSRKTCLCQRHQNMTLKVKGLRSSGIINDTTPDSYIKRKTDDELINEIQQSDCTSIKYTEWQRVEVEHKGRTTKRMQVIQLDKPKEVFIEQMRRDIADFRSHCNRAKVQHEEVRKLKEQLPLDHAIIQMDFAENYVCSHADEVQSAYFDKGSVTLHPTVIYHKTHEDKLVHQSHVIVSDTQMHNSGSVLAFIREIVPVARQLVNNLKTIYYITDSPTSQYRNKHMFYVVANHDKLFADVTASWQYFEAGHGKGPCDGVGGTAKRQADSAVKRQICSIQNAHDFNTWGASQVHSCVKYMFVSNSECTEAYDHLKFLNVKPVKGTMSVHGVVSLGNSCIAVRNTSCFCGDCFADGVFEIKCDGWSKHCVTEASTSVQTAIQPAPTDSNVGNVDIEESVHRAADENIRQQYATNTYVAAIYDSNWYIGSIQEHDPQDNTYLISFMVTSNNKLGTQFKWPEKQDVCWRSYDDILCAVEEPILYGKTRRLYKINDEDLKRIQNLF